MNDILFFNDKDKTITVNYGISDELDELRKTYESLDSILQYYA